MLEESVQRLDASLREAWSDGWQGICKDVPSLTTLEPDTFETMYSAVLLRAITACRELYDKQRDESRKSLKQQKRWQQVKMGARRASYPVPPPDL